MRREKNIKSIKKWKMHQNREDDFFRVLNHPFTDHMVQIQTTFVHTYENSFINNQCPNDLKNIPFE